MGSGEMKTNITGDAPLLVFQIGRLGCTPLDMPEELAKHYGMAYVSRERTRYQLIQARDERGIPPAQARIVSRKDIYATLERQVVPTLNEGKDVMLDGPFNAINSRQYFPLTLAQQSLGALTVGLNVRVLPEIAIQRVTEWTEQDAFVIPVERWEIPPLQQARTQSDRRIQLPAVDEKIKYIFDIDGNATTGEILKQFDDHLLRSGLINTIP